ncbi:MAG: sugar ABC transporter ATP-binding protein [Hyphomicrobiales bacterium]|nr:sugar ABC transporter ATP-binding protein [Hyphomicrobiales bacterium]
MTSGHLIASRALTRDFPGVRALDCVDFDLKRGEVHVLFGENGAGKSTLISVLSGAITPTSGEILMEGRTINPASVHEARQYGISAVFQEFSLIPELTVQENVFLGEEMRRGMFLDKAGMKRESGKLLEQLGFNLDPERRAETLTRAEQQMVEIAKAFRSQVSVLILDEPTASLTDHEIRQLFSLIGTLKKRGVGIIYITHRMAEIYEIGDRVTVLRDGRKIETMEVSKADDETLIRLMTGREVGAVFPDIDLPPPGEEILSLDRITARSGAISDVSMNLKKGEIVGLAGLAGSGKSAAMQAAFGLLPVSSGKVTLKGEDMTGRPPVEMIRRGMIYLPADRKNEGLMMRRSAGENMRLVSLARAPRQNGWFLNAKTEKQSVAALADKLKLSPNRPARAVDHFSGGNQQKVMLARSIAQEFDLIVLNDPTVGVDVGTRASIYRFIADLAMAGTGIIIISSDLLEIIHLSSRAYVFSRGRIRAEVSGRELNEETMLTCFFEDDRECA